MLRVHSQFKLSLETSPANYSTYTNKNIKKEATLEATSAITQAPEQDDTTATAVRMEGTTFTRIKLTST